MRLLFRYRFRKQLENSIANCVDESQGEAMLENILQKTRQMPATQFAVAAGVATAGSAGLARLQKTVRGFSFTIAATAAVALGAILIFTPGSISDPTPTDVVEIPGGQTPLASTAPVSITADPATPADTEGPYVVSHELVDDLVTLTITDADSGIDFDSIYIQNDSEAHIDCEINADAGTIAFPFQAGPAYVHLFDQAGNETIIQITGLTN